ncbi:MAG: gamma-glutamyltransferase [Phycisphaerales bacterium]|nr:gamma-glutamyltransferase [Phycisphaerales bacterium]
MKHIAAWVAAFVLTQASFAAPWTRGAVAADHSVASSAGVEMLKRGGNAIDAAVAVSLTLSVTDPFSCGLGGGGFMVVSIPGPNGQRSDVALNYRERCPEKVDATFFVDHPDASSRYGGTAVAVPGTVAGLWAAHERWGQLPWSECFDPAIRAATSGVQVGGPWLGAMEWVRDRREESPELVHMSDWIWRNLCGSGALTRGSIVRQPSQAALLSKIAAEGPIAFYEGVVAHDIAKAVKRSGGVLSTTDLTRYEPVWSAPLESDLVIGGYRLLSMPPPSSGGIAMQQILGVIDRRMKDAGKPGTARWYHILIEAMRSAFADRAKFGADGTYVPVPIDAMTDPNHLDAAADAIPLDRARTSDEAGVAQLPDDAGTSHFCVMTSDGWAVSCTETINLEFGSLLAVPEWGIVLNNEMDDFATKPGEANAFGLVQSDRNAPAPGKMPLSSMSPTIVLKDGQIRLIAGASGGPRIINGTLQVILNVLLRGMSPEEAVASPRLHHQWLPDVVQFEELWTDGAMIQEMEALGHSTRGRPTVGKVQMIDIRKAGFTPVSDPRKEGVPAGW